MIKVALYDENQDILSKIKAHHPVFLIRLALNGTTVQNTFFELCLSGNYGDNII